MCDELVGQHRADAAVRGWADGVHALYQRATADAATPDADPLLRRRQRQAYEAELEDAVRAVRGRWRQHRSGGSANG